jgi:bifunctional UDP-N-acetylglucosamine pyrophosphorylase/glucosamine-1-phosphate N-acetyltransferase
MSAGVTVLRPETSVIDEDVQVGTDTVLEPFVQLLGNTSVGENCRIRSYSVINNTRIGNDVNVLPGCVMDDSSIANAAIVGPYSRLRPGSDIGEGAHVGNFVETKKTRLGRGSKANHLSYLGDSEIGEKVNIGAGTITCNYDGFSKHRTDIGAGAFIGTNSSLVAPVKIGDGAYIGSGSVITGDVPPDSLALGRGRQVVKEGWAQRLRELKRLAKSGKTG